MPRQTPAQQWLVAMCAALTWIAGKAVGAAESATWLVGPTLEKTLRQETSIDWQDNPLRAGLHKLGQVHQTACLIDRRVDPDQELSIQLRDMPLRDVFQQIAADRRIGVSQFGPLTYFGPRAAAEKLRTLALLRKDEVGKLTADARKSLLRVKRWQWDDLATPRDLLGELAREAGVKLRGLDRIPHDLWGAADLPPLTWIDRLSLVLVQFEATFEVAPSGKEVAIVAIPEDVSIERSFPGGAKPAELAEQWEKLLPECRIKVVDRKIRVRGRLEDIERIESHEQGTTTKTRITGPKEVRFTLTIQQQPLNAVLKQIAEQAKLDLRIDEAAIGKAGKTLDQRVSATATNATLDQLLEAVLKPAGLKFRRQDLVVEIVPEE